MKLNNIVPEVLANICSYLGQFDLIQLCLVEREWLNIAREFLYLSIIVDKSFSRFENEFGLDTFIRTKGNFNLFLKTIKNTNLGINVKSVSIIDLPEIYDWDSIFAGDDGIITRCNLISLKVSPEVNLKNIENLIELNVKIAIYKPLLWKKFDKLKRLSISGVKLDQATKILKLLNDDVKELQIKLKRKIIRNSDLISSNSVGSSLYSNDLFNRISKFNLTKLSLANLCLEIDSMKSLSFETQNNLTHLGLIDCSIINSTLDLFNVMFPKSIPPIRSLNLRINSVNPFIAFHHLSQMPLEQVEITLSTKITEFLKLLPNSIVKLSIITPGSLLNGCQLKEIISLPKLTSLRISISHQLLISELSSLNLEKVWIVGGAQRHFGLGNMYPGVFDKWWRVFEIPKMMTGSSLKYVKIEDCLFKLQEEEVLPKDGLDRWFDKETRVLF
ncbi:hypothetical protein DAMA08_018090 [Martiniozyma asiatica (nom. inval.)]|nr:hypothetical protein DAMA08_018090 [Martiniozyma asiatica]